MAAVPPSHARPAGGASGRSSRQDSYIIEATWLYFHDELNQGEIAKRLNISRASVVNYLAEARRRDYVRITLDSDVFRNNQLASELKERFGIADALIVPTDTTSKIRSFERVVRAASDWLPQFLVAGDDLGVAWGETIYRLAEVAPKLDLHDLTIVQLIGSKPSEIGFAPENCAATLAQRFGAHCANLHVPLLLSTRELCDSLKAEPMIARQLQMIEDCTKVIFAAGTVDENSHIALTGLLDKDILLNMRAQGAAGVICGRIIDQNGVAMPAPNEGQMIGVTLDQMRKKELGMLVSAGVDRVPAARAAMAGGYVTHLVTCSASAQRLLQDEP
ncbi:transcriptional regulator [Rhodophyticola sp. CCM32]|uniref:sugar-binding transcriptional regulator n=1 Tax=Rhodophyticola sp. CCM32 TaxID=2916397 RepID=UPI00107F55BC|nr:sugar-binding domain-containing protein [Rhodophyticola sp. CCM32]QBY01642.1 transcriptional regulator [Rhodophyticola sp. CCM32]